MADKHPMDAATEEVTSLLDVLSEEPTADLREAISELSDLNDTVESVAISKILKALERSADDIDKQFEKASAVAGELEMSLTNINEMVDWDAVE